MPIDVHALAKDRRQIDFEFGGMTMPVTYRPSVMTGRFAQEMADGVTVEDFAKKLCEVIVDWDLMNGSEKLAVNPDAVVDLPTAMVKKMLNDIVEDSGLDSPGEK